MFTKILCFISFCFWMSMLGSQAAPVINSKSPATASSVREMAIVRMSVSASDPSGASLTYNWSLQDLQSVGAEIHYGGGSCELRVPWTQPVPGGHNGKQLVVRLVISNGTEETTTEWTWTVQGVNQPPVAIVEGLLGTSAEPLISGGAIAPDPKKSYDPDGGTLDFQFTIPEIRDYANLCGVVLPVGMNGPEPTINIPPMRSPTQFVIRLTLVDGLHVVTKDVIAYTAPGPNGCNTTSPTNQPPVVFAGNNQTVGFGQSVTIQATASDPDGDPLSYSWAQVSTTGGNLVSLTGASSSKAIFTAPNFSTTLRFEVTVSDGKTSAKSQVSVYVTEGGSSTEPPPTQQNCGDNVAPVANAGADQAVSPGQLVTINGSGYDPDNSEATVLGKVITGVTFKWAVMSSSGLTINLQTDTSQSVSFMAPDVTADTTVVLQLTVTDPLGCTGIDQVNVLIKAAGGSDGRTAKIRYKLDTTFVDASPGAIVAFNAPKEISLVGQQTGFTSPKYSWSKAAGTVGTLGATGSSVKYNVGYFGSETVVDVVITLTVTESTNAAKTATASLTFRITPPPQSPPQAAISRIDPGSQIEPGSLVTITGAATSGGGGTSGDFRYLWNIKCGNGQTVDVFSNGSKAMFVAPPMAGIDELAIEVELVVEEGGVPSEAVKSSVSVKLPTLLFPQIGAGGISGQDFEVQTSVVLVNDTDDDVVGGVVEFFASDGMPLTVLVGGEPKTSETFSIPAGGTRQILLTSDELKVGWTRVKSPVKITGLVIYRYVEQSTGALLAETGLFPSPVSRKFTTLARSGRNEDLALAMANIGPTEITVRVSLREEGAVEDFLVEELILEAHQHTARLLGEIFAASGIPETFAGGIVTLEVEAGCAADLIATVLKMRGLNLSTVPLASRNR
jgi:large repetitive protein